MKTTNKKLAKLFVPALCFTAASFSVTAQPYMAVNKPAPVSAGFSVDTAFLGKNMRDNKMEIDLSQLAIDRSSNQEVKKAAHQMFTDHTQMLNDLARIAQNNNMLAIPGYPTDGGAAPTAGAGTGNAGGNTAGGGTNNNGNGSNNNNAAASSNTGSRNTGSYNNLGTSGTTTAAGATKGAGSTGSGSASGNAGQASGGNAGAGTAGAMNNNANNQRAGSGSNGHQDHTEMQNIAALRRATDIAPRE